MQSLPHGGSAPQSPENNAVHFPPPTVTDVTVMAATVRLGALEALQGIITAELEALT
jgi:hypothetical protein